MGEGHDDGNGRWRRHRGRPGTAEESPRARRRPPAGLALLAGLLLTPLAAIAPSASAATSTNATAKAVPFEVIQAFPRGGRSGVPGTTKIVLTFSRRLASAGPLPAISPRTPGTWTRAWNRLIFVPTVAFAPDTTVTITVPAGAASPLDLAGGPVVGPLTSAFTVSNGSTVRAEQLLAELDYLPVRFVPNASSSLGVIAAARAAFVAPAGRFVWAWNAPAALRSLFSSAASPILLRGALISFERANGLPETGTLTGAEWQLLLRDARAPSRYVQPGGYTYALAQKGSPETLTVWQNGKVVVQTPANTGISQSPTADGNFLVYERLATQIMRGVDPSGVPYADPVSWVAYFNGSDAVHYIGRASYGYPQSLGCVEVPYAAAESAWPYLRIGTVVTVAG